MLLRVAEIVNESGTGFAFPSQTLYLRRDDGLEPERGEAAGEEVSRWRMAGKLPFPDMSQSRLDQLADTLDYPPLGSPDAQSHESLDSAEQLSAEAEDEPESGTGQPVADDLPRSKK